MGTIFAFAAPFALAMAHLLSPSVWRHLRGHALDRGRLGLVIAAGLAFDWFVSVGLGLVAAIFVADAAGHLLSMAGHGERQAALLGAGLMALTGLGLLRRAIRSGAVPAAAADPRPALPATAADPRRAPPTAAAGFDQLLGLMIGNSFALEAIPAFWLATGGQAALLATPIWGWSLGSATGAALAWLALTSSIERLESFARPMAVLSATAALAYAGWVVAVP